MERLDKVKSELVKVFDVYAKTNTSTIGLDVESEEKLKKLMNELFLQAKINHQNKKTSDANAKLRKHLADYLLLLDNFDIKQLTPAKSDA